MIDTIKEQFDMAIIDVLNDFNQKIKDLVQTRQDLSVDIISHRLSDLIFKFQNTLKPQVGEFCVDEA